MSKKIKKSKAGKRGLSGESKGQYKPETYKDPISGGRRFMPLPRTARITGIGGKR
jgi:hypothetical protein